MTRKKDSKYFMRKIKENQLRLKRLDPEQFEESLLRRELRESRARTKRLANLWKQRRMEELKLRRNKK